MIDSAAQQPDFDQYKRVSNALGTSDYSNQIIHYTSHRTLENILQSQELWFGNIAQMNDMSECDHFLDAVLEQSSPLLGGMNVPALEALIQQLRPAIRDDTFVSSWCEYFDAEPDGKLNMWTRYGVAGLGVGLVVDSSKFQPSTITAPNLAFHVYTSKVEYVVRDHAVDLVNNYIKRVLSLPGIGPELSTMAIMLLAKAPCVKHNGFAEEAEIRFLYMDGMRRILGQHTVEDRIRTTSSELGERSFYSLPLINYPQFDFDLRMETILKKVLIGPASGKLERAESVRQILDHHGLQHIAVEVSDIPLR